MENSKFRSTIKSAFAGTRHFTCLLRLNSDVPAPPFTCLSSIRNSIFVYNCERSVNFLKIWIGLHPSPKHWTHQLQAYGIVVESENFHNNNSQLTCEKWVECGCSLWNKRPDSSRSIHVHNSLSYGESVGIRDVIRLHAIIILSLANFIVVPRTVYSFPLLQLQCHY